MAGVLVGCGGSTDRKTDTVVTFPGDERVPDLRVHLRQDARSDQVEELTRDLTLQVKVVAEGARADFEARKVFVFLRSGATPTEIQALRERILNSSMVVDVEP